MKVFSIDLYELYNQPRGTAKEGILHGYLPGNSPEICKNRRRAAVLILPGGAYRFTSDREAEPVALQFLAKGYAAFVLRYSCAPEHFPVQLREASMAMRCIRERADEFGVDPKMVAALGFSAGGHLCGTLGTMYDCPEVADLGAAELLRPDALCLCYPVAVEWGPSHEQTWHNISGGDDGLRRRLSLDKQVRPDMPPVYVWHTRTDDSVPVCNSLTLSQALDAAGVSFAMHIYRLGKHGMSLANQQVYPENAVPVHSAEVPGWVEGVVTFFAECGLKIHD